MNVTGPRRRARQQSLILRNGQTALRLRLAQTWFEFQKEGGASDGQRKIRLRTKTCLRPSASYATPSACFSARPISTISGSTSTMSMAVSEPNIRRPSPRTSTARSPGIFATRWGSVGFFGPLSIRPDPRDRGLAQPLVKAASDAFDAWGVQPFRAVHLSAQRQARWPLSEIRLLPAFPDAADGGVGDALRNARPIRLALCGAVVRRTRRSRTGLPRADRRDLRGPGSHGAKSAPSPRAISAIHCCCAKQGASRASRSAIGGRRAKLARTACS